MRFALVELAHADLLGEFATREEGVEALTGMVAEDPSAAFRVGLLEHDESGEPVGSPVTVSLAEQPWAAVEAALGARLLHARGMPDPEAAARLTLMSVLR